MTINFEVCRIIICYTNIPKLYTTKKEMLNT